MSFYVKLSFDGLHLTGRQDKRLLPFQQKTGSRAIPQGNALKRPLLQLQVLRWGLPGRQQLLQARRSLAEFGFVQCVCDPGAATAEEAYPPWRGRLQGWGWSSQPAVT